MIFPNKVIPITNSLLYKSIFIVKELEKASMDLNQLYEQVIEHFLDINEFILSIDLLYALEKIDLTETEELYIVKKDSL